jgi:aryl-alcohol dehydrogenase-like predicted oxidoreductase
MNIDKIEEYQTDWQYDEMKADVFEYLEELRESGEINMFGAVSYIEETFEISRNMARKFLTDWIRSYKDA